MYRSLIRVVAAALLATFWVEHACAQVDVRLKVAEDGLDAVMKVISTSVLASNLCTSGDMKALFFAIDAIDRRYAFCVGQDSKWRALEQKWEKEKGSKNAQSMKNPGIGSFAYIREMAELPEEVQAVGEEIFCSMAPWNILLNPDEPNTEAKEEFRRAHPHLNIDASLDRILAIRMLGLDRRWIKEPCDKSFWPSYLISERR